MGWKVASKKLFQNGLFTATDNVRESIKNEKVIEQYTGRKFETWSQELEENLQDLKILWS